MSRRRYQLPSAFNLFSAVFHFADQQLFYKSALKEIETLMTDMNSLISELNSIGSSLYGFWEVLNVDKGGRGVLRLEICSGDVIEACDVFR